MLPATLWTAMLTLLIGLFYFYTAFKVGKLRGKYAIQAPATQGHPVFDRAYRVQLNTLEQMGIFLPFLWVAAFYPIPWAYFAPLLGIVWLVGRMWYLRTYMADPDTRLLGALIGGATNIIMFLIAAAGVLRAAVGLSAGA